MTRLKPDQICIVIGPPGSRSVGWLVRTMYLAPVGPMRMPDGSLGLNPFGEPVWICESMVASDFQLMAKISGKWHQISTRFAGFRDCWLKPLPGPEEVAERDSVNMLPDVLEFEDLAA